MKRKYLILFVCWWIAFFALCHLVNARKSRRFERALLLGFLLGSSSNNQQSTAPYPYPQYPMPIFLPTNGIGG